LTGHQAGYGVASTTAGVDCSIVSAIAGKGNRLSPLARASGRMRKIMRGFAVLHHWHERPVRRSMRFGPVAERIAYANIVLTARSQPVYRGTPKTVVSALPQT
jgi:hypothetical protein